MTIEERCDAFKALLLANDSDETIVQSRLIAGEPFIFDGQPEKYANLRASIAEHFQIKLRDTTMVGSAHLGFSIAPNKLWKPFDDHSDIDMVIISDLAFLSYWERIAGYAAGIQTRTEKEAGEFKNFKWHHFNGRIRPDLLPMTLRAEWFDFFRGIPGDLRQHYKVTGTIFYNDNFFEQYHTRNLQRLRASLRLGDLQE